MLSLMDKLRYSCLMMLCCFTLDFVYGEDEGMFSSCEVEVMVRRHTAWRTSPQQSLTVNCPVKHCGKPLNVTWCKLSSNNRCVRIHQTEKVKIAQGYSEGALIAHLTFKAISVPDDGLYRCAVEEFGPVVGHTINISVSDLNQGVESSESRLSSAQPLNSPAFDFSWLPYLYICLSIALLAFALTAMTHLSFHGLKQTLNYKPSAGQEVSTCMIPDLPRRSCPASPVPHVTVLSDTCCPGASGTPVSPPSTIPDRDQPLADESQVYAAINPRQHTSAARKQHTRANSPEYAAISEP